MNTGVQKVGLNIQRKEVGMLPPINFDCAKLSPTKPKLHGEVAVTEDLKNEKI